MSGKMASTGTRNARTAIDALVGVDDEVRVQLAEGFHGADSNAFLVLVVNARGGHNVRHDARCSLKDMNDVQIRA